MISPLSHPQGSLVQPVAGDGALMAKAKDLEAAFLAEMLSFSGLGEVSEGFGGGAGEEQFASFLRQEQAKLMVARGGIGLAETIFESLKLKGAAGDGTA